MKVNTDLMKPCYEGKYRSNEAVMKVNMVLIKFQSHVLLKSNVPYSTPSNQEFSLIILLYKIMQYHC